MYIIYLPSPFHFMSASLIIFILIHIVALSFLVEALRRLLKLYRQYPLKESRQTLPFGFLRVRHIVIIYVLLYLVWIASSFLLYGYFVEPNTPILNL